MIIYKGVDMPGPNGAGRCCVWLDDRRRGSPEGGPFYLPNLLGGSTGLDWGSIEIVGRRLPRPGCDALAFALCCAVLDQHEARTIYKLFQHRHINTLGDGRWTLVHDHLTAWVNAILADMPGYRCVAQMASERVAFERDVGYAANGLPARWDTDDAGKIIPATDPDDMTWSPAPHRRGA